MSSEQIAQHMDFDALLEKAAAPPVSTEEKATPVVNIRRLYWGMGIAASIALAIFVYSGSQQTATINEAKYFAQQPFVNPPSSALKEKTQSFAFNAEDGYSFENNEGAKLVIPAMAFATNRGKAIEGEVEIHYTEYTDYVDFFIAGIPMTYDSLSNKYLLESTGVVDIYATQNGQRIQLAANKSIEVEFTGQWFASQATAPTYHIYHLNQQKRNWQYTSVDQMQVIEGDILNPDDPAYELKLKLQEDIAAVTHDFEEKKAYLENSFISTSKPQKPAKPRDNKLPTFELDFLGDNITFEDQAEKDLYQGTIWQVSEKNTDFDQRMFQVVWDNVLIKKADNKDYLLTFSSATNSVDLLINPVLVGQNYTKANAKYLEDLEKWNAEVAQNQSKLDDEIKIIDQAAQQQIAAIQQNFKENLAVQGILETAVNKKRVINRFAIHELGIWSCAHAIELGENAVPAASFADKNGTIQPNTAFMVDKTKNTISKFLAQPNKSVAFDEQGAPLMWIMLPNNKIATFEDFDKIKASDEAYTFDMNIRDMPTTEKAWRDLLE